MVDHQIEFGPLVRETSRPVLEELFPLCLKMCIFGELVVKERQYALRNVKLFVWDAKLFFGFANLFFHRKYSTTAVGVYVCEMETPPVCYFDYF